MKIIGHRGAKGLAPENTLAAIEAGIQAGVDEIEIDVRVTKDNIPILCHDPALDDFVIADQSFHELRQHKPNLITLEQAVRTINRRVPIDIEVKPNVSTVPIIALLRQWLHQNWLPTDFKLTSFSFRTLKELHAALPEIPVVVLESWSGVRATHRARKLGTKIVCMNQRFLWRGFIRSMQKSGYELYAYPLNDPDKAARWASSGLAGAVTDYPDKLK
ncbi:MAG: glycerophosphodiester phosphodiesterase [Candidatus Saccharimonadales bacterium]